jgi:hypothetical protein
MIVSAQEITRVICLTVHDSATGVARPTICAVAAPTTGRARGVSTWPAAGQDHGFRLCRVIRLRQMLDAGEYSIPPDQVATKMIGRAICDQVAHLVDA